MNYTQKLLTAIMVSLVSLMVLSSCTADGTAYNDLGMTEQNQVFALPSEVSDEAHFYPEVNPKTGYPDAALLDVSKVDGIARKLIIGALGEAVDKVIVTEAKYLIPEFDKTKVFIPFPTKIDPLTGEAELDTPALTGTVGGLVGAAFPGAAPFVPLGLYLFGLLGKRRSRQHLGDMVKAATPYDGKIDIGEAYMSGKKAIGLEHSSEDPEVLIAVAEKKKAIIHAKNGGQAAMAAGYDAAKVDKVA